MTFNKYCFLTIFCYGLVFFLPALATSAQMAIFFTTLFYLCGALFMFLLYTKSLPFLLIEKRSSTWPKILFWGLLGIFIAIFLQNIAITIESLFREYTTSENTQSIIAVVRQQPLFVLAVMFGGPIMEEFVFRRALLGFIANYSTLWLGTILSSLIFALAHNDGHLLVYFFLGCFFAWLYYHTGKIWTSIITHIGMNGLVILLQLLFAFTF
ncbi:MAG: lysostaphin resistance A-like protein [Enterococcus sp.]